MVPDTTGAAHAAGRRSIRSPRRNPGTFLYQAAPLPNAEHQVAMGLYGALVVHPTTAGQAYDDVPTAFNDEAVLVLSEIDPALNNRANKTTFDMRNYAPKYFLINGKAYPDTAAIVERCGKQAPAALRERRRQASFDGHPGFAAEFHRQGRRPAADARPTA